MPIPGRDFRPVLILSGAGDAFSHPERFAVTSDFVGEPAVIISVGHYCFLPDPETFRPHAMGCGMELACGTIDMTNDEFEFRPFVHRDAAGEASIEVFLGRREGDTGDRRALVAG